VTLFDISDAPAALEGPLVRARMTVAYDGSGFHGFAPNPGVRTVGGTLSEAIRKVTRSPVELTCAGRTDTGVHAWGQVVSFDLPADRFDPPALARSLNRLLAPAIVVRDLCRAPDDFDARRSAVGRTYRYTIVNRPVADPFLARVAWHVAEPLAIDLLRLGCDPLVGEHDFSAFCRKPKQRGRERPEASLVRHVRRAGWTDVGDGVLRFDIEADAFCHQMIRSVVGTLVDVGLARKHAGELLGILASRDRSRASALAPPHGLCLWEVAYPDTGAG
jgi:tRNA pseudouridine38-40 synthase